MRGIDRVVAGLLLAGAIGGAALFARSSGGLPTAAVHLGQAPKQSLTAPDPIVIPLLPAADHVQQVIHLAGSRPVRTTLLPPGLYVKNAEISLPGVGPQRTRPVHALPVRPVAPSGGSTKPTIPVEPSTPAPVAPATPPLAAPTPTPSPAPVETAPAPEQPTSPRVPASTTLTPTPVQPTPVPQPPPIPVTTAPSQGEQASSGNVHGLTSPPHDPTPAPAPAAPPASSEQQNGNSQGDQGSTTTVSAPPFAVKPAP